MPERQELPLEPLRLSHTSQAFVKIAIERDKVKLNAFFNPCCFPLAYVVSQSM